eukprot:jgi/Ulvmu1/6110/UM027_0088.1
MQRLFAAVGGRASGYRRAPAQRLPLTDGHQSVTTAAQACQQDAANSRCTELIMITFLGFASCTPTPQAQTFVCMPIHTTCCMSFHGVCQHAHTRDGALAHVDQRCSYP